MRFSLASRRLSLKARLIWSYLVILGTGGLATSLVGSWIVSSTIMTQARRAVDHDFATARTVYEQQLQALKLSVEFAASGHHRPTATSPPATGVSLAAYLERIRQDAGFDFLTLTDARGGVVLRVSQTRPRHGDDASSIGIVKAALSGKVAAGTEILPPPRGVRRLHGGRLAGWRRGDRAGAVPPAPAGRPVRRRPSDRELRHCGPRLGTAVSRRPVPGRGQRLRHHLPERSSHLDQRPNRGRRAGSRHAGAGRRPRRRSETGRDLARAGVYREGLATSASTIPFATMPGTSSACSPSEFWRTPTPPSATA